MSNDMKSLGEEGNTKGYTLEEEGNTFFPSSENDSEIGGVTSDNSVESGPLVPWRVPWHELTDAAIGDWRQAARSWLSLRFGYNDAARSLVERVIDARLIGWSEGLGKPWLESHPAVVALRNVEGHVVSAIRRWTAAHAPADGKKVMQLSKKTLGVDTLPPMFLGDVPAAVTAARTGQPIWLVEGEPDWLLYSGLALTREIDGAVLGFPGGGSSSKAWWATLAAAFDGVPVKTVYLATHKDKAGDNYAQAALGVWPHAIRIPYKPGEDACDIARAWGLDELLTTVAAAKPAESPWWILDSGAYAYQTPEGWSLCRSTAALEAHIRAAGRDAKAARELVSMLPVASEIVCDPSTTAVVISGRPPRLNMYRGLAVKPLEVPWFAIEHLLEHLCGGDDAAIGYMLDWIAVPLQALASGQGAKRTGVAPIIMGSQGSGKGFLSRVLRALYGVHHTEIGNEQIQDRFSVFNFDACLLLVANEVQSASWEREAAVLDKLKPWVTDDQIPVRDMFRSARPKAAHFNMLVLSNHDMPVRPEQWDRRYTFIEQRKPLPEAVIKELDAESKAGWPAAAGFLHYLLNRPPPELPMRPLANATREAQLALARPSQEIFASELVELGLEAVGARWREQAELKFKGSPPSAWAARGDNEADAHGQRLQEIYEAWCHGQGHKRPVRWDVLAKSIQRAIPGAQWTVVSVGNQKQRGFRGLPLRGRLLTTTPDAPATQGGIWQH